MVETDLSEVEAGDIERYVNQGTSIAEVIEEEGPRATAKAILEFTEWAEDTEDPPEWTNGD